MRFVKNLALLALLGPLAGCLTHMPPEDIAHAAHLQIKWRPSFEAACADAKELKRPILLVTAAGDITGFC